YALSDFQRRVTYADGTSLNLESKVGDVHWGQAGRVHAGENIGQTDTHSLMFELLEPRPESELDRHV
ncbi:hypothetical protein NL386_37860, partial [Klebsiella pneumoniae]|nr:hypothetical protein [Klebsiella pneumoniae]